MKLEVRKFMVQFIGQKDGRRTKPFVTTFDELHDILDTSPSGQGPEDNDYILVVAVLDGERTVIPDTPLFTVKSFIEKHSATKFHTVETVEEETQNG